MSATPKFVGMLQKSSGHDEDELRISWSGTKSLNERMVGAFSAHHYQ